jgi:hypothetical protein
MLSLARSRYTLLAQLVFLAINAVGMLTSTIYNASTPDLYPNNAHHKIGWIATWVISTQVIVGLLGRVSGYLKGEKDSAVSGAERQSFMPVSQEAMAEHRRRNVSPERNPYRHSNDSGQGTEPNTDSLPGHSRSNSGTSSPMHEAKEFDDFEDEDLEPALPALARDSAPHSLLRKVAGMMSSRVWKIALFGYNFVDRTILVLGFIALCTGIITFGRFFVSLQLHPPSTCIGFGRGGVPANSRKPEYHAAIHRLYANKSCTN